MMMMMNTNSLSSNSPSFTILTKHSLPSSSSSNHKPFFLPQQRHTPLRLFNPITCTSSTNNENSKNNNDADSIQAQTTSDDSEVVGVRFRRRSRRLSRQQRENNNGAAVPSTRTKVSESPKKWEEMSLSEKAIELYMGEKGALFWLNKFAYASIFIMIGAWIVFRFVGPALNLYQLDSPPLAPSDVFKGSSSS